MSRPVQICLECYTRQKMGLEHADGYGITSCLLTHRSREPMGLTARSITMTYMQNHSSPTQTSTERRDLPTITAKCSFQNSAAGISSIEHWENWVMWDLLQKSTGSVPIERFVPASAENRMPSMLSFYKPKQHTPSPSTTLPGLMPLPMLGLRYSSSLSTNNNLALDPILPPLP
jgi:hypothetical protein